MPAPLGNEKAWYSASLVNSPDDVTVNNHDGVFIGSMGIVDDTRVGGTRAFDFDGNDSAITLPSSLNFGIGEFSWSAWIYRYVGSASYESLLSFTQSGALPFYPSFYCGNDGNNTGLFGCWWGTGNRYDSSQSIAKSIWTHVGFRRQLENCRFYYNGLPAGDFTIPISRTIANNQIALGYEPGAFDYFWEGRQDDIRFYDVALSDADFLLLGAGRTSNPPDTFGSYLAANATRINQ